ncbi:hypothetical protein [uncultured Microbulbifer sp.]|uniref:hypothetical protein n=1 Tax=uncultured Microbulbifer sp. TaxID=348147 RepID=UPI0026175BF8|nr:hypothetical protein [uncultured Microbulbifer sp.]
MVNGVFNIAKGRVNAYTESVAGDDLESSALVVVLLQVAQEDANLAASERLSEVLSASNVEADFTNYERKVLSDVEPPTTDHTSGVQSADIPDQVWTAAGGAQNNTLVKLLVCYTPDSVNGTDDQVVPLTYHDFPINTDGSDLLAQINAAGFFRSV